LLLLHGMSENRFRKRLNSLDSVISKPWLVGLISVGSSVLIYTILIQFVPLRDVAIGYYLSIGIPAVVGPMVAFMVRGYIGRIEKKNQELAELDATNKRLFSVISHDLRSPLASLKTVMDLLVEEQLSLEEGKLMIKDLSQKTNRLLDFLNEILTWSMRQTEARPQSAQQFDARASIESILKLFEDQRLAKNIDLETNDLAGSMYADPDSFSFVFRNVYQNALKFTPPGGKIEVYTEKKAQHLHTIIKDDGVGMSPEVLEKVLDPQELYSAQGTNAEQGTGFGISSAINYLKDNHGELKVETEEGQGSKFRIVLPLFSLP